MKFLQNLFKKKEDAVKKEEVHAHELDTWFSILTRNHTQSVTKQCGTLFLRMREERQALTRNLLALEKAELENKDIPVKEKQFMEGNRAAYMKKVQDFLQATKLPETSHPKEAKKFLSTHEKEFAAFTRNSVRAYQILLHFFGNELGETSQTLKNIDEITKEIQEILEEKKTKTVAELEECILEMQQLVKEREKLLEEVEKLEQEYETLKTLKADYTLRLLKITKDPRYIELQELETKKAKIETELKMLKASFVNEFLQIEKALKKFAKLDDEKFITAYVDNPVEAVLADEGLRILGIIARIQEAIQQNQIGLEEKKKEKILERIQALDRQFLIQFVIAHNDLLLKMEDVKRALKKNTSKTEQDDLQYKIDHVTTKQQHTSTHIGKMHGMIERISIAEQAKQIESLAKACEAHIQVIL